MVTDRQVKLLAEARGRQPKGHGGLATTLSPAIWEVEVVLLLDTDEKGVFEAAQVFEELQGLLSTFTRFTNFLGSVPPHRSRSSKPPIAVA